MNVLSIVIATRNRSHLLGGLIDRFDREVIKPAGLVFELIFVDNNSTDDTEETIKEYMAHERPYSLRYVFEGKSGLSNARNRGIETAAHDYISFLDDDIEPDVNFLQAIQEAFIAHPDILCFAHRVVTHQVNKPEWYCLEGPYRMLNRGTYDLGTPSRLLNAVDPSPIGSGMIVSKQVFAEFGSFDPGFGYDLSGSIMVPGEESELFFKAREKGTHIFYVHDALINHFPVDEKYDDHSLCKTYKGIGFWYGSVDARNLRHKTIKTWVGFPRSYYKRLIKTGCNLIFHRLSANKTIKNYYRFKWEETKGYFLGYSAFRKRGNGRNA